MKMKTVYLTENELYPVLIEEEAQPYDYKVEIPENLYEAWTSAYDAWRCLEDMISDLAEKQNEAHSDK